MNNSGHLGNKMTKTLSGGGGAHSLKGGGGQHIITVQYKVTSSLRGDLNPPEMRKPRPGQLLFL